MGLVSRKKGQDSAAPPPEEDGHPDQVEVTMAGPDAERLEGLIDMSAVAAVLRRRAAGGDPPKP